MDLHLRVNPVSRFFSSPKEIRVRADRFSVISKVADIASGYEGWLYAGNAAVLTFAWLFGVSVRDLLAAFIMAGVMACSAPTCTRRFTFDRSFCRGMSGTVSCAHCLSYITWAIRIRISPCSISVDKLFGSLTIQDPLRGAGKKNDDALD
jgi:hypothetical protein